MPADASVRKGNLAPVTPDATARHVQDDPAPALAETTQARSAPACRNEEPNNPNDGPGVNARAPSSTASDDPASPKLPPATPRPSRIGLGHAIEKSQLQIASERRIRNKAHLSYVASKPCLVCEDTPSHAHHVIFAQRRGLSQKVSDEFTVPLCALHHNGVHLSGAERAWWRAQGIEPLKVAYLLWQESVVRDNL
jgi:hypothetical protein